VYLQPMRAAPTPRVEELDTLTPDLKSFDRLQARTLPYTPPYNITGQPSLSLPLWHTADGLPLGMMFTARYGDEATLFRLAGQLEKELPWAGRRPPVWG
jgi:amidase